MPGLRIAIVGAGAMGRVHADSVGACGRCELAAVVDPREVAWGVPWFGAVGEMLAAGRPDGAIVATPNDLHVPAALELVGAGVPVLVEKPVADTVMAGEELAAAARAAGVAVLVGHHRRHGAAMREAVACIGRGELGRIVAAQVTTLFYKPDGYFEADWRRGPAGGPILINLVHDVDNLRALCGEVVAVQAMATSRHRGFVAEDTAAVLLEFASGALGTMLLSDTAVATRSWEHTSGENPVYPRDTGQECIFVAGDRGAISVPRMRVWGQEGERSWMRPFTVRDLRVGEVDPLAAQLEHYCDVIEGARPLVGVEDAVRSLEVVLAVREAARVGGRVRVG